MTSIIPTTRKRSRSSEEEDFIPLSKKINNLHINQWRTCVDEVTPQSVWVESTNALPHSNAFQVAQTTPSFHNGPQTSQSWPTPYEPDLSKEDNPFYYDTNKVLYECYMARLHRSTF